jgi:hypothetical protein
MMLMADLSWLRCAKHKAQSIPVNLVCVCVCVCHGVVK